MHSKKLSNWYKRQLISDEHEVFTGFIPCLQNYLQHRVEISLLKIQDPLSLSIAFTFKILHLSTTAHLIASYYMSQLCHVSCCYLIFPFFSAHLPTPVLSFCHRNHAPNTSSRKGSKTEKWRSATHRHAPLTLFHCFLLRTSPTLNLWGGEGENCQSGDWA